MSEYTRTVLSELQVATMGSVGCGAVSHVRSSDGGVSSDNRAICALAMTGLSFPCVICKQSSGREISRLDGCGEEGLIR